MKFIFATILSLTLMFSTGYARDLPDVMPKLEVTGLVSGLKVKAAAILNDRIVYEGYIFEVTEDSKLGARVVPGGRVKVGPIIIQVEKITDKGVTVHYLERETGYVETKLIPLKSRA